MIPAPGRHYSWDLASEVAFDRSACTEYLVLSNSYVGQFPNRPFCSRLRQGSPAGVAPQWWISLFKHEREK